MVTGFESYIYIKNDLGMNSKGEKVRKMQQLLINLGYNLGRWGADGIFGKVTLSAVKKFQNDNNIRATGIVDTATLSAMNRRIEQFRKIKNAQQMLSDIDYDLGRWGADGRLGPVTMKAIKQFQSDQNLRPTGKLTDKTYQKIKLLWAQDALIKLNFNVKFNGKLDDKTKKSILLFARGSETKEYYKIYVNLVNNVVSDDLINMLRDYIPLSKNIKVSRKELNDKLGKETVDFFKPFDLGNGEMLVGAIFQAAKLMNMPPELLLAVAINENISIKEVIVNGKVSEKKFREVMRQLHSEGRNLWRIGTYDERGPTQIKPSTVRYIMNVKGFIAPEIKKMLRSLKAKAKTKAELKEYYAVEYMIASVAYLKFIHMKNNLGIKENEIKNMTQQEINNIDLTNLTDKQLENIYFHYNAGHNARGRTNAYARTALYTYYKIINNELAQYMPGRIQAKEILI